MNARLEYIKDIVGSNFIGINIYADTIYPFLEKMKTHTGDDYEDFSKNQQDRDTNHYHCTVMNVGDLNKVAQKNLNIVNVLNDVLNTFEADDLQLVGLGSVQRNGNKAYFVVCRSLQLQAFRRRFGLEEIDLHITIGFKWKDVHGLRKNIVLADKEPFLDELLQYFTEFDESFNFIKELENYDFDITKDIFCTKLKPTYAEFRVGNEYGVANYFTVASIGDKLTIACRWESSDEVPYLSNTLILRKLKNENGH